MRSESEFLVDVLQRLKAAGVDYMLTGSMAANYWGIPRTTHDLDVVLAINPDQMDMLISAFDIGFLIQSESVRSDLRALRQFSLTDEQSAIRADFWLLQDDAFEQTAFGRRLQVVLFSVSAWIVTAEDIILHKLYRNRLVPSEQQLGDAAGVYAVQSDSLDTSYLRQWAVQLGAQRELYELIAGKIKPKTT